MPALSNYRVAACVCFLLALLGLPAASLELLLPFSSQDSTVAELSTLSLSLTLLQAALYSYVLLCLKRCLSSRAVSWTLWLMVLLQLSSAVLATAEYTLAGGHEYLSLIAWLTLSVVYGFLSLLLGFQIFALKERAAVFRPFAYLTVVIALLMLTVLLAVAALLVDVFALCALGFAFLQLRKGGATAPQPLADTVTAVSTAASERSATEFSPLQVGAVVLLLVSIILSAAELDSQLELWMLPFSIGGNRLDVLLPLVLILKAALGFRLTGGLSGAPTLRFWFASLAAVGALMLAAELFADDVRAYLPDLSPIKVLMIVIPYALSLVSGIVLLRIGSELQTASDAQLHGYRPALKACLYVTAILSIIMLFPDAVLLGHLFIDLILLLLALSYCRYFTVLRLSSYRWGPLLCVLLLVIAPFGAYLKSALQPLQEQLDSSPSVLSEMIDIIFETEYTAIPSVEGDSAQQALNEVQATQIKSTLIFDDVWLFSAGERSATAGGNLYRSADAGLTWDFEQELVVHGSSISFSEDGKRGTIGDSMNGYQVTEDGGESWRLLNPDTLFTQLTGVQDRDSMYSYYTMYLDPESGYGAVGGRCDLYISEDFGHSWQQREAVDARGKRICLGENPFAINRDYSLATGGSLMRKSLYKYAEDLGYWQERCVIDGLVLPSEECVNQTNLSPEERRMLELFNADEADFGGARASDADAQDIKDYHKLPVAAMKYPPPRAEAQHWVATPGFLSTTIDEGQSWRIEQNIQAFTRVFPVDEAVAFAVDADGQLWLSRDSGSRWQRFFSVSESPVLAVEPAQQGHYLWVLFPDKLMRIDTREQQSKLIREFDYFNFDNMGLSLDGSSLWLSSSHSDSASFSFDGGRQWQELHALPYQKTAHGDWLLPHLVDISCEQGELYCYVLLSSGSVAQVSFGEAGVTLDLSTVGPLPAEAFEYSDGYVYGQLLVREQGREFIVAPSDDRQAYISRDAGGHWATNKLRARKEWESLELSANGGSVILAGEDAVVISHDFGASWKAVNPMQWGDRINYCWDASAELIYLFDQERIAVSIDGGGSWQEAAFRSRSAPFCGVANGKMWLKTQDLTVYALGEKQ